MQTKTPYIPTREQKSAVPLGNFDIHEDENILVNRLYYAVPNFENGRFQCSVFYEENIFRKESNGDLMLVHLIQKLKSRKSRIKPGLFAFLLAERIIFGKKTQKTGENTGFSPVSFFHVLHGYVVHFGSDTGFSPPGFIRSQPSSSPPAPKTHPVSPFSGFSGCVFLFFAVFRPQNFCPGFCASCRIASTS